VAVAEAVALAVVWGCGWAGEEPRIDPDPSLLARRVASRVVSDYPKPPAFDWGEGVLLTGMVRVGTLPGSGDALVDWEAETKSRP
jgi:hypothetical protein